MTQIFFAGPVAFSTLGNSHEFPESPFLQVKNDNNNYTETSPFLFHHKGQTIYDVAAYKNGKRCLCEKGFLWRTCKYALSELPHGPVQISDSPHILLIRMNLIHTYGSNHHLYPDGSQISIFHSDLTTYISTE